MAEVQKETQSASNTGAVEHQHVPMDELFSYGEPMRERWRALIDGLSTNPIHDLYGVAECIAKIAQYAQDEGDPYYYFSLKQVGRQYAEALVTSQVFEIYHQRRRKKLSDMCYYLRPSGDRPQRTDKDKSWLDPRDTDSFIKDVIDLQDKPINTFEKLVEFIHNLGLPIDTPDLQYEADEFLQTLHFASWLNKQDRQAICNVLIREDDLE